MLCGSVGWPDPDGGIGKRPAACAYRSTILPRIHSYFLFSCTVYDLQTAVRRNTRRPRLRLFCLHSQCLSHAPQAQPPAQLPHADDGHDITHWTPLHFARLSLSYAARIRPTSCAASAPQAKSASNTRRKAWPCLPPPSCGRARRWQARSRVGLTEGPLRARPACRATCASWRPR